MKVILDKKSILKQVTSIYKTPNDLLIKILEEILDHYSFEIKNNILHITSSQEGWRVNYKYFMDKYNFGFAKIRYSLRKLVAHKLITKEQINIGNKGSEIILKINFEKIKNFIHI